MVVVIVLALATEAVDKDGDNNDTNDSDKHSNDQSSALGLVRIAHCFSFTFQPVERVQAASGASISQNVIVRQALVLFVVLVGGLDPDDVFATATVTRIFTSLLGQIVGVHLFNKGIAADGDHEANDESEEESGDAHLFFFLIQKLNFIYN